MSFDSVGNSPSTPCNFSSENISQKTFERKHKIVSLLFHLCTMCFVIDQAILSGMHIFTFANSSRNIPLNISFFIHVLSTFGVPISSLQCYRYRWILHLQVQMSPISGDAQRPNSCGPLLRQLWPFWQGKLSSIVTIMKSSKKVTRRVMATITCTSSK